MTGTVNIPLLRKAVEWAEAEAAKPPGTGAWLQGEWTTTPKTHQCARRKAELAPGCGTTFCIAGYVCEVEGLKVRHDWHTLAANALGLDPYQANRLFNGNNTIEDVRRIADAITGERL